MLRPTHRRGARTLVRRNPETFAALNLFMMHVNTKTPERGSASRSTNASSFAIFPLGFRNSSFFGYCSLAIGHSLAFLAPLLIPAALFAADHREEIPLWPNGAPGS